MGQIALEDEQEWNSIEDRMTEQKVRRSERINSNRRQLEEDWVRNADGKDYGCPECGMWFFTGEGVRLHMDNAHSHKPNRSEINEKMSQGKSLRYGCTDCENSFPSELMAINHMRSHNEEEDGKESVGEENQGEVEEKETEEGMEGESEENPHVGQKETEGMEQNGEVHEMETEGREANQGEVEDKETQEGMEGESEENPHVGQKETEGMEQNGEVHEMETEGREANQGEVEDKEMQEGMEGESEENPHVGRKERNKMEKCMRWKRKEGKQIKER